MMEFLIRVERDWIDPATGLRCVMVWGPTGTLNGYVGVPVDHPWQGLNYDDVGGVEVHGGLTFSGELDHVLGDAMTTHFLGFDTGHYGDYLPFAPHLGGHEWTPEGVARECERLAAQIAGVTA